MLAAMNIDRAGLQVLSRDECLRLLPEARIGRIGFHAGALPVILPVAFAVDADSVVVRVLAGSQLDLATRDAVVAFEADDMDVDGKRGWSVTATGVATEISDPAELARARRLPLGAWGSEEDARLVRISLELISGRRDTSGVRGEVGDEPAPDLGATGPAAVAETHSGIVFFVGDRAYKLKKAVNFGFLDFRAREARLDACRREVALNRRLAPDVYLGVGDLSGPDGQVCDHMVVMRRMPDDRRLSTLVRSGAAVDEHLANLARSLASFHASAPSSAVIARAASRDAVAERWEANAAEMTPFRGELLDGQTFDDVVGLARQFLAGRQPLFQQRIAEGRARDGHGDLLAGDIFCLDDGPRVLDCLEFDDHLRYGDVLADVAFLAMDLERLGRPDLAALFLGAYRQESGDCWPDSLADHYVAYRAQVRAKVACLRWSQGAVAVRRDADHLLRLCRDHLRRARMRLVLVGGLPGTGKSTVARGIATPLRALVLRSDEVRKEIAGLDPTTHGDAAFDVGLYRPAATAGTYAELLDRARLALGLGQSVVVDATWRDPAWRQAAADVAASAAADLVELRCVAPLDVAVDRVNRRRAIGADPSDASESVTRMLAVADVPWTTANDVDTSGDAGRAVATALAYINGAGSERAA